MIIWYHQVGGINRDMIISNSSQVTSKPLGHVVTHIILVKMLILYFIYLFQDEHSKLAAQINTTKKLLEELKLEEGEEIDPKAEKLK